MKYQSLLENKLKTAEAELKYLKKYGAHDRVETYVNYYPFTKPHLFTSVKIQQKSSELEMEIEYCRSQLRIAPILVVKETSIGKGLFTTEYISKGRLVATLAGPTNDLKNLPDFNNPYLLEVAHKKYIIPNEPERYINHSCEPNCSIDVDNFDYTANLISIKDIPVNTEITFDYSVTSSDLYDTWKMDCLCGTKNCRKIISGFKTLTTEQADMLAQSNFIPKWVEK